jgi:hypothetical protein
MTGLANDLNISETGFVSHNGAGIFHGRTLTAGTGITITNGTGVSGDPIITSTAAATDLHTARFIVASSTSGTGANFTNITAAIAAAQGTGINSTIFLQPGTYTENFTLPANINLAAYQCDSTTPNVTIVGNITCTDAGNRSISGINLQTNSAAFLTVSGSAATVVLLFGCFLNCTNATGIVYSSSSSSSSILITECRGNIATTGIALFSMSGAGSLAFNYSQMSNGGGSTTASTVSAGTFTAGYTLITNPITVSGTGGIGFGSSVIVCTNTTCLTLGGSGSQNILQSQVQSGTASAITISTTANVNECIVSSSNANAITGAGTVKYGQIDFISTSSTINTSTQTALNSQAGVQRLTGLGIGAASTGTGLTFDGTSTLSVFSQGTFNVTIRGSGTAGTVAMSNNAGRYQKIGRLATVSIYCNWTTIGTATGNVQCDNLPFTAVNNATTAFCPSLVTTGTFNLALGVNAVAYMNPAGNTTAANILYYIGAAATAAANTTITATNGFATQLTYETV